MKRTPIISLIVVASLSLAGGIVALNVLNDSGPLLALDDGHGPTIDLNRIDFTGLTAGEVYDNDTALTLFSNYSTDSDIIASVTNVTNVVSATNAISLAVTSSVQVVSSQELDVTGGVPLFNPDYHVTIPQGTTHVSIVTSGISLLDLNGLTISLPGTLEGVLTLEGGQIVDGLGNIVASILSAGNNEVIIDLAAAGLDASEGSFEMDIKQDNLVGQLVGGLLSNITITALVADEVYAFSSFKIVASTPIYSMNIAGTNLDHLLVNGLVIDEGVEAFQTQVSEIEFTTVGTDNEVVNITSIEMWGCDPNPA